MRKCHERFLRAGVFLRERTGIIVFCVFTGAAWVY